MRLSWLRETLLRLDTSEILQAIRERRKIIRNHRDQKGDDRCWLDDYLVWAMLYDTPKEPKMLLPTDEAMWFCREFWMFRQSSMPDPTPADANFNSEIWDDDLLRMNNAELLNQLILIQEAIREHRDTPHLRGRPRTIHDDRRLYEVLPEKIPADFRLPAEKEFLGEARAPKAGCPSFWRSHANCPVKSHNLHAWGPCS